MKKALVYIHGKGGNAEECEHYKPIFPDCDVFGFDYRSQTPWEAQTEFPAYFNELCRDYDSVSIIANSIGAYFALNSLCDIPLQKAYFISPVADMEKLICTMLSWAGVTEAALREKGTIETDFGETLSWDYLNWVREHPFSWHTPSVILYGQRDNLQSRETICEFAERINAALTVMENSEHWFHTPEQMAFLDNWIRK